MAPVWSKLGPVSMETKLLGVLSSGALGIWLYSTRDAAAAARSRKIASKTELNINVSDSSKGKRVQVDGEFFRSLSLLLKIAIPGLYTPEVFWLSLVAATLIARSLCDIWMINNGTLIESAIISGNLPAFSGHLVSFFLAMPTLSLVNNVMKFGLSKLKLRFRARLSTYLYGLYLSGFTYYKMSHVDSRIANPDQLLTQDVDRFCDSIVDLYSNMSKPLLDILIYVQKLSVTIGAQAPGVMILYMVTSGFILTGLRRPLSRLTVEEQRLEGEFRFVHSRLLTNAEEIAFYRGNQRERKNIFEAFSRLMNHLLKLARFRFTMGFVDNIVAKYLATCVGFTVVAYPYLTPGSTVAKMSYRDRMEAYYKSGRMLVKLAEAIGRLVLAGRELTRLAGFTARVRDLVDVLLDLEKGVCVRTKVEVPQSRSSENEVPITQGTSKQILPSGTPSGTPSSSSTPATPSGKVVTQDNLIRFDRVPLVTPNGEVLIKEMSFEVRSGVNVLVCGPNGCGKSSLFRILGELWAPSGGVVTKPLPGQLFYIPQRPYMTLGTLRDQVIYPDSPSDVDRKGFTDAQLALYLERVQLSHILEREERGWEAVQDWMDVLSGGEKQRVAMARLFYHCPQFAILDECTSAVSVDVEGEMYRYCRERGITLFTVSHRKSLWKHHEFYLHMDGRGSFEFKAIQEDTLQFGS